MKRIVYSLVLLIALLVSACGGAVAPQPSEQSQPVAATDNQSSSEKIEIKFWAHQSNSFNEANQQVVDQFMADNPDVTIKYETFPWDVFIQTLQTSLPAGTTADVVQLPSGYACLYGPGGQLLEVPSDLMSYDQAKEIFFNAPLDSYYCAGKLYGLPIEYNLEYGGAFVNQALFDKAGVTFPPNWQSFTAVVDDAKKMVEMDGDQMTVAGLHFTNADALFTYFLSGILQAGGSYLGEDGKHFQFDTPEAKQTLQWLSDMAQKDGVVDPIIYNNQTSWVGEVFAQQKAGIAILGSWYGGDAKITHPDLTFDYTALPPIFGTEHKFVSAGGWGEVVTKNTQHPEIAFRLVQALAADQENAFLFNSQTGTIPAQKALVANPDAYLEKAPYVKPILPILGNGVFVGNLTDTGQLEFSIITPHIESVLQGLETVDEAALAIHEEANAMVDAMK